MKQVTTKVYSDSADGISAFFFTARGRMLSAQVGARYRVDIQEIAEVVAGVLAGRRAPDASWAGCHGAPTAREMHDAHEALSDAQLIFRRDGDGIFRRDGDGDGDYEREFFSALSRYRRGAPADYVAIASPWDDGGSLAPAWMADKKRVALEIWLEENPDAPAEQKEQAQDAIRALDEASEEIPVDGDDWSVARSLDELDWLDPVED